MPTQSRKPARSSPNDCSHRPTQGEAALIAARLLTSNLSPWWRAFVLVSVHCGLRPCEVARLQWSDLTGLPTSRLAVRGCSAMVVESSEGERLPVFLSRVPKTRVRDIAIDAQTFEGLMVLRERDESPYVFLSEDWLQRCWPLYDAGTMPRVSDLLPGLSREFSYVQQEAIKEIGEDMWEPLSVSMLRSALLAMTAISQSETFRSCRFRSQPKQNRSSKRTRSQPTAKAGVA